MQYNVDQTSSTSASLVSLQKNILLLEASNVVTFGGNNIRFGVISRTNSLSLIYVCSVEWIHNRVELQGFCMFKHCTASVSYYYRKV